ncbi:hypothetical protein [Anabaena sp. CCY 9402-a]|uniref:hypothetical protein n=1 Tax=Anabaena sp. CCY 9402-a TaxID=3103867 RepID=UPI0039C6CAAD
MQVFELILQWLVNLSIVIVAIAVYLNINKIWSRKHEPAVAESISVSGRSISILVSLPFILNFIFKANVPSVLSYLILFSNDIILFLTGIGFWVRDGKRTSIWQKLWRSLRQEKKEAGNLIKAIAKPTGEEQLLEILHRLAWLDGSLSEQERHYIETFTESWEINTKDILMHQPPETGVESFQYLRQAVKEYLNLEPPIEQVQMFNDLVKTLISADKVITSEEELIAEEMAAIVNQYISQGASNYFGVIVHPRNLEQKDSVRNALPEAQAEFLLGGHAFLAGTFHTRRYAEVMSESYRQQGWFTVVYEYAVPK